MGFMGFNSKQCVHGCVCVWLVVKASHIQFISFSVHQCGWLVYTLYTSWLCIWIFYTNIGFNACPVFKIFQFNAVSWNAIQGWHVCDVRQIVAARRTKMLIGVFLSSFTVQTFYILANILNFVFTFYVLYFVFCNVFSIFMVVGSFLPPFSGLIFTTQTHISDLISFVATLGNQIGSFLSLPISFDIIKITFIIVKMFVHFTCTLIKYNEQWHASSKVFPFLIDLIQLP